MIITITIYKHVKLVITPLEWFIWPVWRRDWNQTFRAKQIEVAWKPTPVWGTPPNSQYVTRQAQTDFYVWILFLRVHFPLWYTYTDVADIFPANYNWKDDPDYNKKHQQLADTGYFA